MPGATEEMAVELQRQAEVAVLLGLQVREKMAETNPAVIRVAAEALRDHSQQQEQTRQEEKVRMEFKGVALAVSALLLVREVAEVSSREVLADQGP